MKSMTLLALAILTVSCGKHTETQVIYREPSTVAAPEVVDVQNLIDDENDYRLNLGQTMLSKGLSCSLQTFTGGDRIQASIANHNTLQGLSSVGSFLLKDTFNQVQSPVSDGLNVLPASLRTTYKTNYLLRCTGYLVVTSNDTYSFDLTSDDASVIYVAGAKVIDNDNGHGTVSVRATKYLRRGVHAFRIDYAQQGGEQSLVLKMNDELVTPSNMVH